MKKEEAIKLQAEHMENRTQWHEKDVKQMEQVRNEMSALQNDGKLTKEAKENNKVVHKH